jgi:hypothetical protein
VSPTGDEPGASEPVGHQRRNARLPDRRVKERLGSLAFGGREKL